MNLLRERRQALGLTQRQVARKLREVEPRINGPMVSRYEQGMCLAHERAAHKAGGDLASLQERPL